jgi:predicted transport protein
MTDFNEKINKLFIGFKNDKNYFATIIYRKSYLYLWIPDFKGEVAPSENLKYYPETGLEVKINSHEDLIKYIPLVKQSTRYKGQ